ncbi:MAG: sulfur carrier protein ThiS [Gammaproteobacteria bacterium]|nr:sulfur carrier protein ThiS [Gammaproteobacteria bacterium]
MQITLNGDSKILDDDCSVLGLLEQLGLVGRRIAVEINLEILPASQHSLHRLSEGDRVEIIQAIGGG